MQLQEWIIRRIEWLERNVFISASLYTITKPVKPDGRGEAGGSPPLIFLGGGGWHSYISQFSGLKFKISCWRKPPEFPSHYNQLLKSAIETYSAYSCFAKLGCFASTLRKRNFRTGKRYERRTSAASVGASWIYNWYFIVC